MFFLQVFTVHKEDTKVGEDREAFVSSVSSVSFASFFEYRNKTAYLFKGWTVFVFGPPTFLAECRMGWCHREEAISEDYYRR